MIIADLFLEKILTLDLLPWDLMLHFGSKMVMDSVVPGPASADTIDPANHKDIGSEEVEQARRAIAARVASRIGLCSGPSGIFNSGLYVRCPAFNEEVVDSLSRQQGEELWAQKQAEGGQ